MPGNPFRKPFKGGKTRAAAGRPQKPNARQSNVPTPQMPNGVKSRSVRQPATGAVKVTGKGRRGLPMPPVRQGAQVGTPGRSGSRPGARYE